LCAPLFDSFQVTRIRRAPYRRRV